jgi:hypothetical protein
VVSRSFTRQGIALAVLAAAELVVVAVIGRAYGTDGTASTLGALVLAPVAVVATAAFARRIAGERFAIAAAVAYVVLPLLATRFMLVTYRATFEHQALPDLVGLRATPWFALGVLLTAALVAPRRAAGVSGAVAAVAALIVWGSADLASIRNGLHETAWSITLLEWFVVAGFIGAARRNGWLAVALVGWLLAIILHAAHVGYDNAAFWQSLAAGATLAAVLLTSLALLVPPLRRPRPAQSPGHAG